MKLMCCEESCIPFDMESTWSAALVLLIVSIVDPSLSENNDSSLHTAYTVLDEMSSRGNRIAAYRRAELLQLQTTLQTLATRRTDLSAEAMSPGQDTITVDSASLGHPSLDYLQTQCAFQNGHLDAVADSLDVAGLHWLSVDSLEQLDASLL